MIPHQHLNEDKPEGPKVCWGKIMLVLAVTLHNIPEGFAVGLTFAIAASNSSITFASALALALGIGLQNLPEGAAISLPLNRKECHVQRLLFMEVFQELLNLLQELLLVYNSYYANNITYLFIICCRSDDVCCSRRTHSRSTAW